MTISKTKSKPDSQLCNYCDQPCYGDVLKVKTKLFHVECFKCFECGVDLRKVNDFHESKHVDREIILCDTDWIRLIAARCHICHQTIIQGSVVHAFDRTFHQQCFQCFRCRGKIDSGANVVLKEKQILCELCFKDVIPGDGSSILPVSPTEDGAQTYNNGALTLDSAMKLQTDATNRSGRSKQQSRSRFDFGKFFQTSYLNKIGGVETYMKRAGSAPGHPKEKQEDIPQQTPMRHVTQKETSLPRSDDFSPTRHHHRPEDLSFTQPSKKFIRKRGMLKLVAVPRRVKTVVKPEDRGIKMGVEDTIRSSHYPGGQQPTDDAVTPIERDDFPAPPESSLIISDKLRHKDEQLGGPRKAASMEALDNMDNEALLDPKLVTEIEYLKRVQGEHARTSGHSGHGCAIADGVLKGLIKEATAATQLDPRSASRAPAANKMIALPTRYLSAMYASPSRFTDHVRADELGWPFELLDGAATADPGAMREALSGPPPGTATMPAALPSAVDAYRDGLPARHVPRGLYSFEKERMEREAGSEGEEQLDEDDTEEEAPRRRNTTPTKGRRSRSRTHSPVGRGEGEVHSPISDEYRRVRDGLRGGGPQRGIEADTPGSLPEKARFMELDALKAAVQEFNATRRESGSLDVRNVERYLDDDEFKKVFRMPRGVFSHLSEKERHELKRRNDLLAV